MPPTHKLTCIPHQNTCQFEYAGVTHNNKMCDISNNRKFFTVIFLTLIPKSFCQFNPQFQQPDYNVQPVQETFNQNVNQDRFNNNERQSFRRDVRELLAALDLQGSQQCTKNVAAQWDFETNVNQATQLEAVSEIGYLTGSGKAWEK